VRDKAKITFYAMPVRADHREPGVMHAHFSTVVGDDGAARIGSKNKTASQVNHVSWLRKDNQSVPIVVATLDSNDRVTNLELNQVGLRSLMEGLTAIPAERAPPCDELFGGAMFQTSTLPDLYELISQEAQNDRIVTVDRDFKTGLDAKSRHSAAQWRSAPAIPYEGTRVADVLFEITAANGTFTKPKTNIKKGHGALFRPAGELGFFVNKRTEAKMMQWIEVLVDDNGDYETTTQRARNRSTGTNKSTAKTKTTAQPKPKRHRVGGSSASNAEWNGDGGDMGVRELLDFVEEWNLLIELQHEEVDRRDERAVRRFLQRHIVSG